MNALDPSTIIPVRLIAVQHRSWRDGLFGLAEGAVSLLLNIGAMVGMIHLAFPPTEPTSEPNTITVDLVPAVPKTVGTPSSKPPAAGSSSLAAPGPKSIATPTPPGQQKAADRSQPPPSRPPPEPERPQPSPAPPEKLAGAPVATPQPTPTAPAPSAPPPDAPPTLDAGTNPAPRLIEAPPDPRRAAQQADKPVAANAETKPAATAKPVETPPPSAPLIVATPNPSAEARPEPMSTADSAKPAPAASAEEKREAENTAKLAAAIPFSQNFLPAETRAPLSGSGSETADRYRGEVYGAFHKADDLMESARDRHLRGQAVVVFSIDDKGSLTGVRVAVSSGDPAVDQTAMEIIRRAAPYPPPPPGGQHTFSPAIGFGMDQP